MKPSPMKLSPMKLRQMKPSQKHAVNKCCQTSTSLSLGAWFVIPIEACCQTSAVITYISALGAVE